MNLSQIKAAVTRLVNNGTYANRYSAAYCIATKHTIANGKSAAEHKALVEKLMDTDNGR